MSVTDVTAAYAVLSVMGPRSRDLLSSVSRADLSEGAFPFATSRLVDVGVAMVRATRITYVGELGWELYVPVEFALGVYEELMAAGRGLGIVNAGYRDAAQCTCLQAGGEGPRGRALSARACLGPESRITKHVGRRLREPGSGGRPEAGWAFAGRGGFPVAGPAKRQPPKAAAGLPTGNLRPSGRRGCQYTIGSLRLEKAYRAWGAELTPDTNPVEAGLLFTCKLSSPVDFLGREAVEKARAEGVRQRLVSLVLDDPGVMMWGDELVLRDGVPVGQITSAAWGATVGSAVALAYVSGPGAVSADYLRVGQYTVNVGGRVVPAALHLRAPYDPDGIRVRPRPTASS